MFILLIAELQRMKKQHEQSKAYMEAQEAEERKLLKIIAEADAERVRQKKELDQVFHHDRFSHTHYVSNFQSILKVDLRLALAFTCIHVSFTVFFDA